MCRRCAILRVGINVQPAAYRRSWSFSLWQELQRHFHMVRFVWRWFHPATSRQWWVHPESFRAFRRLWLLTRYVMFCPAAATNVLPRPRRGHGKRILGNGNTSLSFFDSWTPGPASVLFTEPKCCCWLGFSQQAQGFAWLLKRIYGLIGLHSFWALTGFCLQLQSSVIIHLSSSEYLVWRTFLSGRSFSCKSSEELKQELSRSVLNAWCYWSLLLTELDIDVLTLVVCFCSSKHWSTSRKSFGKQVYVSHWVSGCWYLYKTFKAECWFRCTKQQWCFNGHLQELTAD